MNPYAILSQTEHQRVSDGMTRPLLENCEIASHILILVWPQLGDFDSLGAIRLVERVLRRGMAGNV